MALIAYPNIPLSQSSDFTFDERIYESRFGDGYSQRVGQGTNSNFATLRLRHDLITQIELNQLMTFWNQVGKSGTFTLALPHDGVTRKWRFTSGLNVAAISGALYNVSVDAEQDFSLVT